MSTYSDYADIEEDDTPDGLDWGGVLLVILPFLWLLIFFLFPLLSVLKVSLSDTAAVSPFYMPVFEMGAGWEGVKALWSGFDFESFLGLASEDIYWKSYLASFKFALISTFITLLIGYPMAYGMAKTSQRLRSILLMLVLLPFLVSIVVRVYAWMVILQPEGILNHLLMSYGIIAEPLKLLHSETAVYIGAVYTYLPLMILPLYFFLIKVDKRLSEAAMDLGCSRMSAFWRVTFPMSLPGLVLGCLFVFTPMMGAFVLPDLLGGSEPFMVGQTLWSSFFDQQNWPVMSAVAVVLLLLLVLPIVLFRRAMENKLGAEL